MPPATLVQLQQDNAKLAKELAMLRIGNERLREGLRDRAQAAHILGREFDPYSTVHSGAFEDCVAEPCVEAGALLEARDEC